MTLKNHWMLYTAFAVAWFSGYDRPAAQSEVNQQLRVLPNAQAHSEPVPLTATTALTVRVEQAPSPVDGVVRVYVFDAHGVLSGLDDPDVDAAAFTFTPSTAGKFTVMVINTNTTPIRVRISLLGARGTPAPVGEFARVRVLYATNRRLDPTAHAHFDSEPGDALVYGFCDISIPRDHRLGELEAPTIWRLEFREDPTHHVVVLSTDTEAESAFLKHFADRVSQSLKREALVFVHGFNQSFEDATKRTAQLAYDLAFDGPAIAFSWPSQGSIAPAAYMRDQRNADLSAQLLGDLLLRLRATSKQVTVHVIAHSMGNRVLTRALERISRDATSDRPLGEVALMAPDVDAALFRQASRQIAASARRVTLYASSEDEALKVAEQVARYPRAGQGGAGIMIVPGVDTVDASSVPTSLLGVGHSYYADNSTILSDLFALIRGRRPSERFGLRLVSVPSGTYWKFSPAVR